ncbi:uncharacterized protein [Salminus brasiliensis]|uniref:uncharacterized protein isoform X3 n=1 Tax=Salminus brasiliensis TaxID=930266 RepID=UPI003B832593
MMDVTRMMTGRVGLLLLSVFVVTSLVIGKGQTETGPTVLLKDCTQIKNAFPNVKSGVYTIRPSQASFKMMDVTRMMTGRVGLLLLSVFVVTSLVIGKGQTETGPTVLLKDCTQIKNAFPNVKSGVYTIRPSQASFKMMDVTRMMTGRVGLLLLSVFVVTSLVIGKGQTETGPTVLLKDCTQIKNAFPNVKSGVYTIRPSQASFKGQHLKTTSAREITAV